MDLDWKQGIDVWKQFSDFPHPVDPIPKPVDVIEKLGLLANSKAKQQVKDSADLSDSKNSSDDQQIIEDQPASKKLRQEHPMIPAFRATCYRSNKLNSKHIFQSPQAASAFGGSINDHFGWIVDLKNFDIEVVLTIEDNHVYVSISLTKESLHRRNITHFGPTVLRPTIAYNMLR